MQISRWAQQLEQLDADVDIKKQVTKLELRYWVWFIASAALLGFGFVLLMISLPANTELMIIASFLALVGLILLITVKIWANIHLAKFTIIKLLQKKFSNPND